MVIDEGEVVHIMERRSFDGDVRRHFAGRVDRVDGELIRLTGFVYGFHPGLRRFELRNQVRTRVCSMSDSRLTINVLPATVDPVKLRYQFRDDESLFVSQGDWEMDLTEFVWKSS
jgi:hypothetical protein